MNAMKNMSAACAAQTAARTEILTNGSELPAAGSELPAAGSEVLAAGTEMLTAGTEMLANGSEVLTNGRVEEVAPGFKWVAHNEMLTNGGVR